MDPRKGKDMKTGTVMVIAIAVCCMLLCGLSYAGDVKPVDVKQNDRCPVCGMLVYKFKSWQAQIVFNDGAFAAFDGPKDMLKYYFAMNKYGSSKKTSDIAAVYVTEYYSARLMDARALFYVAGSDVYGPMGPELVPLANEASARTFMKDHNAGKVLKFGDITPEALP